MSPRPAGCVPWVDCLTSLSLAVHIREMGMMLSLCKGLAGREHSITSDLPSHASPISSCLLPYFFLFNLLASALFPGHFKHDSELDDLV